MNLRLRTLLLGSIVATGLAFGATSVNAQQVNGVYVSGGIGFNQLRDSTVSGGAVNSDIDFKHGWAGVAALGYGFGNGFRVEGELGYRKNDVDSSSAGAGNGEAKQTSLMANVLYDFATGTDFTPYLGAGLGGVRTKFDGVGTLTGGRTVDDSSTEFAYQALAGVAYKLTNEWSLDLGYRYMASLDPSFTTNDGIGVDGEVRNHTLLLSVRYAFGAPRAAAPEPVRPVAAPAPAPVPPPPAPAAAAPPPPAPPALQRSYLVFFDFDRADVTAEAGRVIQQAATNAKAGNVSRIQATGHTDRAGSTQYNQALSMRRANAVRDALVRAGIPANQIVVLARGESEPLVPTADGAREPQNRRVEILLQ